MWFLEKEKSKDLKIMVPTILAKLNIEPKHQISRNSSIKRHSIPKENILPDATPNNGNNSINMLRLWCAKCYAGL